jgi:hypothetical protein
MRSLSTRTAALALVFTAVLTIVGCGAKNLILRVDLLSFLDPSETQGHYGPVPGGLSDSLTIAADRSIDLVPGISSVTVVKSADLEIVGEFRNDTGTGSGTVKIYLSDPATDPLTTTPIVVPVTLAPATTDTVSISLAGDPRIAALFTEEAMRLAIKLTLTSAAGPDPIEGDFVLTRLRAIVIAGQDVF